MTSPNRSRFSAAAGLAMLASVPTVAQSAPTTIVDEGNFEVLTQREVGDRDPNGPEFIVRYERMHEGDYTFDQGGIRGRAIDCDDMVAGDDGNGGLEWKLTGRFLAMSADLADGSSFDNAFNQRSGAVVGSTFINSYRRHIHGGPIETSAGEYRGLEYNNIRHHRDSEVMAVAGYCNTRYGPSND